MLRTEEILATKTQSKTDIHPFANRPYKAAPKDFLSVLVT